MQWLPHMVHVVIPAPMPTSPSPWDTRLTCLWVHPHPRLSALSAMDEGHTHCLTWRALDSAAAPSRDPQTGCTPSSGGAVPTSPRAFSTSALSPPALLPRALARGHGLATETGSPLLHRATRATGVVNGVLPNDSSDARLFIGGITSVASSNQTLI